MTLAVLLLLALAGGVWFAIARHIRETDRAVLETCDSIVDRHMAALVRQRAHLVEYDPYGRPLAEKWNKEIAYFMKTQIAPQLQPTELKSFHKQWARAEAQIESRVAEAEANNPALSALPANASGEQFEDFCAEQLRRTGWDAQLTKGSGDQGVDVIAQKNGVRLVLQCKFYGQPVGNKAVQEVAAGKLHERAHHGAVVTNNVYTRAARQLAQTTGVLLLHHSQLCGIDDILGMNGVEKAS